VPDIAVSVQAEPADPRSWLALARRLEDSGFHGLVMGDHPGCGASPWPALGSAAAVTQTLTLGTCMVQAGVREPMHWTFSRRAGWCWAWAQVIRRANGQTSASTGRARSSGQNACGPG